MTLNKYKLTPENTRIIYSDGRYHLTIEEIAEIARRKVETERDEWLGGIVERMRQQNWERVNDPRERVKAHE